ncbi:MAG TPA: STAS/SEC14 domain-containing protein [Gemmatimonadaceae bacterium]|nr:STAS/SEC14 domain-containing protein [Gemmatimonadaceae bacterium]
MPVAMVQADARTVLVRVMGDVTFEEVQRFLDDLARVRDTHGAVALLADCRGVESTVSAAEMRQLVDDLRPFIRSGINRFALVTDRTWMYGIGRMFGALAELADAKVNVFRDMDAAQKWLDEQSPG